MDTVLTVLGAIVIVCLFVYSFTRKKSTVKQVQGVTETSSGGQTTGDSGQDSTKIIP